MPNDEDRDLLLPKCLIVLDEPFYEYKNQLFCPLTWWQFADEIALYCEKLTLFVPLSEKKPPEGARPIDPKHINIAKHYFYRSIIGYYLKLFLYKYKLLKRGSVLLENHELVLFRLPAPISFPLAKIALKKKVPLAVIVGGDLLEASRYMQSNVFFKMIFKVFGSYVRFKELSIARKSLLTVCWGDRLKSIFFKVCQSTYIGSAPNIREQDIYIRDSNDFRNNIKIICVANILPNKGITYLVDAVYELKKKGYEVYLDLVGGVEDRNYYRELSDQIGKLGIEDLIVFHGRKNFGVDLFELYKKANIQVLPSLSEGIPRCISEGRAFGLPIIATKAGGIPLLVEHEKDGILVEMNNSEQIVTAVERLVKDKNFKDQIVNQSYKTINTQTIEFQAYRLAKLIHDSLKGKDVKEWGDDLTKLFSSG